VIYVYMVCSLLSFQVLKACLRGDHNYAWAVRGAKEAQHVYILATREHRSKNPMLGVA